MIIFGATVARRLQPWGVEDVTHHWPVNGPFPYPVACLDVSLHFLEYQPLVVYSVRSCGETALRKRLANRLGLE